MHIQHYFLGLSLSLIMTKVVKIMILLKIGKGSKDRNWEIITQIVRSYKIMKFIYMHLKSYMCAYIN